MTENQIDALLTQIQQAALCPYLSDLRYTPFDDHTRTLICQIPDESYSLEEWNEAAAYITGLSHCVASVKEAKELISGK